MYDSQIIFHRDFKGLDFDDLESRLNGKGMKPESNEVEVVVEIEFKYKQPEAKEEHIATDKVDFSEKSVKLDEDFEFLTPNSAFRQQPTTTNKHIDLRGVTNKIKTFLQLSARKRLC